MSENVIQEKHPASRLIFSKNSYTRSYKTIHINNQANFYIDIFDTEFFNKPHLVFNVGKLLKEGDVSLDLVTSTSPMPKALKIVNQQYFFNETCHYKIPSRSRINSISIKGYSVDNQNFKFYEEIDFPHIQATVRSFSIFQEADSSNYLIYVQVEPEYILNRNNIGAFN